MMTTVKNGSQYDIYPAIVTNSTGGQSSFQYLYVIRKPYASNDQNDDLVNSTQNQNFRTPFNLNSNNLCPNGQLPPLYSQNNPPIYEKSSTLGNSTKGSSTQGSSTTQNPLSQDIKCQSGIGLQSGDGGSRFLDSFKGFYSGLEVKRNFR
jgi:hypothetical protein